jgi:hypothetical protein
VLSGREQESGLQPDFVRKNAITRTGIRVLCAVSAFCKATGASGDLPGYKSVHVTNGSVGLTYGSARYV